MKVQLKPLAEQTIVITGASSGIGLATAKLAAERGARVVLAAREEEALQKAEEEIRAAGGAAAHVVANVANEQDVRRVAEAAAQRFGGFDTWVNNAGVSVYGRIEEVSLRDQRALFEVNYWGVVHGSRVAVEHLRRKGGALINVGSVLSDHAVPMQGPYSASKHAVKGFTDALRMELIEEGAPVSVTLIKPSAIDTPFVKHTKNYMEVEPALPPPLYAPELVAEAILHAAEHPVRDLVVGAGGRLMTAFGQLLPRLSDKVMSRVGIAMQRTSQPARRHRVGLHAPSGEGETHGDRQGPVLRHSAYTWAQMHPMATLAIAVGLGAAAAAAMRPRAVRRLGRGLRRGG